MKRDRKPSAKMERAVQRAAQLRATGMSWKEIASVLNMSWHSIKNWPAMFRTHWDQLIASYQQSVTLDAKSEAMGALRVLLRSEKEHICRDAAKEILDQHGPISTDPGQAPISDLHRFADYLEGLSDEDLCALLGAKDIRELGGPEGGTGGAAPPAGAK